MRKPLPLSVALLLVTAPLRSQQTADDIIAKYLQRVGGLERIQSAHSLRRTGKFYGGGGFEAEVRYENKRPNLVREEFVLGGMTGVNAYDGKTGWKIEPWQGKKDAESLSEDEIKSIVEDSEFDDPLFNHQQKGNKVELIGTDQIEGTDVYKVKATLASNGDVRTYYMDADSYVPIKIEVKRTVRGADREFEVDLGDYKEVNGWYLPFSTAIGLKGSSSANKTQIAWERIEVNVALDNQRFAKPVTGAPPGSSADAGAAPTRAPASPERPRPSEAGKPMATSPVQGPVNSRGLPVARVDSETTSGLGARNIGSAAMSGRIAAIAAVHEGDRLTLYVGAASGGVWKSTNGGTTFTPVFDKQPVQSIGAVTIDPTNPKVIWVGTGESWMRNSISIGDGVYRSTDGGENWTNMGLRESEHIVKILVDPSDAKNVYVCVPGKLWSDSNERGVYRTTDGGTTWSKVLGGSNGSTGCSMMSMDAQHPKTLYAGLWDFRRTGWTFRSGGDGPEAPSGSGLFKSTDGGATWAPLDETTANGLPPKPWGASPSPSRRRSRTWCTHSLRRFRRSTHCIAPTTAARRGRRRTAART